MQPHDEFVRVCAGGIKGFEGCSLDQCDWLRRWGIDTNRIPQVCHLHANVQNRLIARGEGDDFTVCPEAGNEGSGSHDATVEDLAPERAGEATTSDIVCGGGGNVLKNRAICWSNR